MKYLITVSLIFFTLIGVVNSHADDHIHTIYIPAAFSQPVEAVDYVTLIDYRPHPIPGHDYVTAYVTFDWSDWATVTEADSIQVYVYDVPGGHNDPSSWRLEANIINGETSYTFWCVTGPFYTLQYDGFRVPEPGAFLISNMPLCSDFPGTWKAPP